jgi:hypothetical protein
MEWPDGTQDATRIGDDWRAHALPQWVTRDFHGVAHGFREAAEAVYDSLASRPPDTLYLPLQYLWRHHIELMLKANIVICSRVAGISTPVPSGHDLRALFQQFLELSAEEPGRDEQISNTHAEQALDSFLALEPSPDASRYPSDRGGSPYARPERVDLSELRNTALAVSSLLNGAFDFADALLGAIPDDHPR